MLNKWIEESEHEQKFHDNSVMSVCQWIIVISIMLVPVLNVVMLFKWAFSSKELVLANKVNFARAVIIMFAILFIAIGFVALLLWFGWNIQCNLDF